jgi:hypothetical protein
MSPPRGEGSHRLWAIGRIQVQLLAIGWDRFDLRDVVIGVCPDERCYDSECASGRTTQTATSIHVAGILSQFAVYAMKMHLTPALRPCMMCLVWGPFPSNRTRHVRRGV